MDNMVMGLSTTVIGITIVFGVLCLLSVILSLLKYTAPSDGGIKKEITPRPADNRPRDSKKKIEPVPENLINDKELVAVITAAIAAYLPEDSPGIVVRSIRRTEKWNAAARGSYALQKGR